MAMAITMTTIMMIKATMINKDTATMAITMTADTIKAMMATSTTDTTMLATKGIKMNITTTNTTIKALRLKDMAAVATVVGVEADVVTIPKRTLKPSATSQ